MDGDTHNFLDTPRWSGKVFVGGWTASSAGEVEVTAPSDGRFVARVGKANADDVARAAAAAAAAQPGWEATPAHLRAEAEAERRHAGEVDFLGEFPACIIFAKAGGGDHRVAEEFPGVRRDGGKRLGHG